MSKIKFREWRFEKKINMFEQQIDLKKAKQDASVFRIFSQRKVFSEQGIVSSVYMVNPRSLVRPNSKRGVSGLLILLHKSAPYFLPVDFTSNQREALVTNKLEVYHKNKTLQLSLSFHTISLLRFQPNECIQRQWCPSATPQLEAGRVGVSHL